MEKKEIVICAAVKAVSGKIFRGHRHSDCYAVIHDNKLKASLHINAEGFITSHNRFVTREEGQKLQIKAGIKSADKDGYSNGMLFSEDLY